MTSKINLKEQLKRDLKKAQNYFETFPWDDRTVYADWLSQTYYYVCHSTRLLGLCSSRVSMEQNAFHLRCIEHMREEKAHEVLAKGDLKQIGYPAIPFPELTSTAALYQTQYYLIEHHEPLGFLGYILFLEGIAATKAAFAYDKVCITYGKKAGTFLSVHADNDDAHIASAFKQIEKVTDDQLKEISLNLSRTAQLYCQMLQDILDRQQSAERTDLVATG